MERIGIGVIGAGIIGGEHAKVFASDPRTRLVGVCDLDLERARALAATHGAPFHTSELAALLARDDIQAVSVATPDHAHLDAAVEAARAGKHILCEKPLATSTADARSIVEAAAAAGVSLMVDFHNRFNPPFVHVKRAIETGEIGEPQLLQLRLSDTIYVPTRMLSWAAKASVAWFLACHCVDLVRWLTGREVERVYAVARSRVLRAMGIDTPDFYHLTLELGGGCVATVENCWILSEAAPTIADFRAEIVGATGHANVQTLPHSVVTLAGPSGYRNPDCLGGVDVHGRLVGFAYESVRHFVDHLVDGVPLVATGADGVEATRVICAAEESARSGQPVEVTA